MNIITEYPFFSGFGVGMALLLYFWWVNLSNRRSLTRKIRDLKAHLNTQMEITANGNRTLMVEIEQLKKKNENLRISIQSWQQKPGRGDMRTLHLYDKALHLMLQRTPGFSPVWENVLHEAEEEISKTERGAVALVRKFFVSSFNRKPDVYANVSLPNYQDGRNQIINN